MTTTAPRFELRAMTFGEILDGALKIYRDHAGLLFGMTFACYVPELVFSAMYSPSAKPQIGPVFLNLLIMTFTGIVVAGLVTTLACQVVEGRDTSFGSLMSHMSGRWGKYVVGTFVLSIVTGLGLVAFVVPGILYFFRRSLFTPAVVFESVEGYGAAFDRSRKLIGRLAGGRADKVFLVFLVVGLLGWALGSGVGMVVPASLGGLSRALAQLPRVAITPLSSLAIALIYVDARVRDEGYDLQVRTGATSAA